MQVISSLEFIQAASLSSTMELSVRRRQQDIFSFDRKGWWPTGDCQFMNGAMFIEVLELLEQDRSADGVKARQDIIAILGPLRTSVRAGLDSMTDSTTG